MLIPFGLFGKTAFMAERVLGNVVSSGIKVLVLAVIIGIDCEALAPALSLAPLLVHSPSAPRLRQR